MIPESIKFLIEAHNGDTIVSDSILHGGDINKASKIEMKSGNSLFLKWNDTAPEDMFEKEARALEILSSANTELEIPQVIGFGNMFLLLEFLEESPTGNAFNFGVQLAKLHRSSNELFGFDESNYIGKLTQSNKYHADWLEFFIRERIEPQVRLAIDSNKLSSKYHSIFDRVMNYTYVVFPDEPPALLHGDLWAGNYMFTKDGRASIYDPALYFGHREMDIAMSKLFGGFDEEFYNGYNEEYPLKRGFEERIKLCNLYPILVHANLFGGSYIDQAESILKRFF